MGCGEGLVQVQVHDVKAHVARTHDSDERVHVRAVIVEQSAALMHQSGDFPDFSLEEAERVRIGHHDSGNRLVQQRLQVLHVYAPVRTRLDLNDLKAADGC